jgi:hypothetical protein
MASLVSPGALPAALLEALRARFGERLSTAAAVREHHSRDESYHQPQLPDAVLFATCRWWRSARARRWRGT